MSHICIRGSFMSHLLMTARFAGRAEAHRSDWSHRSTDVASAALSLLRPPRLSVGLPVCLSISMVLSVSLLQPISAFKRQRNEMLFILCLWVDFFSPFFLIARPPPFLKKNFKSSSRCRTTTLIPILCKCIFLSHIPKMPF